MAGKYRKYLFAGVYLRRVMLYFDKLSFSQTISLFRSYQHYVKIGKHTHPDKTEASLFPGEALPLLELDSAASVSMDMASTSEIVLPPSTTLAEDMKHIRWVSFFPQYFHVSNMLNLI